MLLYLQLHMHLNFSYMLYTYICNICFSSVVHKYVCICDICHTGEFRVHIL